MLNSLQIVTGDLEENCYVLWNDGSTDAVVFDPGAEPEKIRRELRARKLNIAAFVQTHCHGDHIAALTPLKAVYPAAPIYCPEAEVEWLSRPTLNLSYFYGFSVTAPAPEHRVNDSDVIKACGFELKAIHVPGHSPGGTAYFVAPLSVDGEGPGVRSGPPHLFCGDILFAGSIGRTDLPGGGGEELLVEGIRTKLFTLPDNTIVHPGHGPETTIGEEKENNPYCQ
jgi:glyoxylase-like metal-dependent hydrolase (beta-lactamase superfamily II)